jgi:hypothetical protein
MKLSDKRNKIFFAAVFLFFSVQIFALNKTYYLDPAIGNDGNTGLLQSTPWKTLTKINGITFQSGDSILIKSGSIFTGQLKPMGSGSMGNPIVIDRYGGTVKPIINGNGLTGQGTLYLSNQEYWEINNLEITNTAATEADRRGILIFSSASGVKHHIYLRHLDIHDISGIIDVSSDAAKRTAGIGFEGSTATSRFDSILIEGCNIYNIKSTGIYTDNTDSRTDYPYTSGWLARRYTNVVIRNNVIHDIIKNAMILRVLDGGIIEYNVCYNTAFDPGGTTMQGNTMFTADCGGTVFQYNEGYLNKANGSNFGDGSMYDADLRSPNTVFQYSYSHDNNHGLFWTCTVQQDTGIICRYNISQNDKGNIFCVNYPVNSVYIYNNSVYIPSSLSPTIISERNMNSGTRNYYFYNNIIYNLSTTSSYEWHSAYTRTFNCNVFYGQHPSEEATIIDPHKLTSNPKFVNPGSGAFGLNSLSGYKLQSSSPCINSGYRVFNHSSQDFFGNSIYPDSIVDRGANEFNYAPPMGSLLLKCLIEGFYNGTSMIPDTVTVELHNTATPYASIASSKGVLDSSGLGTFNFSGAVNGTSYFIVVKHRNAVETWSIASIISSTYDFTSAQSQVYGNNMILKGSKWCIYSGDVSQDGQVSFSDLMAVDNDNTNFITGYTYTDLTGDNQVTFSDLILVDNNNTNFVSKVIPPVAPRVQKAYQ